MPFRIVRDDIVNLKVDAVVNAANTELRMGGGVCGAIFRAAGADALREACAPLAPIPCGGAVITPGFRLNARFIIHTAGPVYRGGKSGESRLLRSCYVNALRLAQQNGCASVAFPLISSGIYGYPREEALAIATSVIADFLLHEDDGMTVLLVVFDKASFALSTKLLGDVAAYIDEHYVEQHFEPASNRRLRAADFEDPTNLNEAARYGPTPKSSVPSDLDAIVDNLSESFSQALLHLIDRKGRTDVEVYKRANLDRKLFSKIRVGKDYNPAKKTVLALSVALELELGETRELLERAGYALSPSRKFDMIVEYFIANRRYDIFEINEVLFHYDQPLLG